jgi:hypothetical protein
MKRAIRSVSATIPASCGLPGPKYFEAAVITDELRCPGGGGGLDGGLFVRRNPPPRSSAPTSVLLTSSLFCVGLRA